MPWVRSLASNHGCAVAVLDAPGHGDRRESSTPPPLDAFLSHWGEHKGDRIAREYAAAAAALRSTPEVGAGPIGYWGLSLATMYGMAYLASSGEVVAAVLGLFRKTRDLARYAESVICPVFFLLQRDDEHHPEKKVNALFTALASSEKHLERNPGRHEDVPAHACQDAVAFLVDRLRAAAQQGAGLLPEGG
ncbi:MAG: hypothetical protein ACE5JO_00415 [Candidatus Binatia bacterium]